MKNIEGEAGQEGMSHRIDPGFYKLWPMGRAELAKNAGPHEWLLIMLYRQWSEDYYAASFMDPTEATVRQFMHWLEGRLQSQTELGPYEKKFLQIYHRLNAESIENA